MTALMKWRLRAGYTHQVRCRPATEYTISWCRGRHAVSTWQLLESLAQGTAALMQWRLRTGRTHQIRVHAKHMGHPLLCDESYGGAGSTAVNMIAQGKSTRCG